MALVEPGPADGKVSFAWVLDMECHILNSNWVLGGMWGCNKYWYGSSHFWNAASATASSGCSHAVAQSSSGEEEDGFDLIGMASEPACDVVPSALFVSGIVYLLPSA